MSNLGIFSLKVNIILIVVISTNFIKSKLFYFVFEILIDLYYLELMFYKTLKAIICPILT